MSNFRIAHNPPTTHAAADLPFVNWRLGHPSSGLSMDHSAYNVLVSRSAVLLLMLLVWCLYFLNARLAYRSFSGRRMLQFLTVVGSAAVFCLQVFTMERLSPEDTYASHFAIFIFAEAGGALVVLFWTLIRERAKTRSKPI